MKFTIEFSKILKEVFCLYREVFHLNMEDIYCGKEVIILNTEVVGRWLQLSSLLHHESYL